MRKKAEVKVGEKDSAKGGAGEFFVAQMNISALPLSMWLPITSKKTGYKVFLTLPIRLIQQLPDSEGGCIVRGSHEDECVCKENIVEVLGRLNGIPVAEVSSLAIAT